jgi:hypothetical protein
MYDVTHRCLSGVEGGGKGREKTRREKMGREKREERRRGERREKSENVKYLDFSSKNNFNIFRY